MGWQRSTSVSIASMLRYIMVVGFMKFSLSDMQGISTGMPPACKTPFLTFSAKILKCRWQGLISDQVLMMPITGLPAQSSGPNPN